MRIYLLHSILFLKPDKKEIWHLFYFSTLSDSLTWEQTWECSSFIFKHDIDIKSSQNNFTLQIIKHSLIGQDGSCIWKQFGNAILVSEQYFFFWNLL